MSLRFALAASTTASISQDFPLNLDAVQKPVIYFPAGVYAMAARLEFEFRWVRKHPASQRLEGSTTFACMRRGSAVM